MVLHKYFPTLNYARLLSTKCDCTYSAGEGSATVSKLSNKIKKLSAGTVIVITNHLAENVKESAHGHSYVVGAVIGEDGVLHKK